MKRPRQHVLEYESILALCNFLPKNWIVDEMGKHDYGIDIQIQLVKDETVLPHFIFIQLKATDKSLTKVTYSMDTAHIKYYEGFQVPVVILYWIKQRDEFYFLHM